MSNSNKNYYFPIIISILCIIVYLIPYSIGTIDRLNNLEKSFSEIKNLKLLEIEKNIIKNPNFKNEIINYMFKNSNRKVSRDDLETIFDYTYDEGKDPYWIFYLSIQKIESDWYQYAFSINKIIEDDKVIKKEIARGVAGIHKLWTNKLIKEGIWKDERDVFSISKNIDAQKRIFSEYLKLEKGNTWQTLISYCLGPYSLLTKRDQTKYPEKVMKVFGDISLIISKNKNEI